MSRLAWYRDRLATMNAAEIAWRTSAVARNAVRELAGDRLLRSRPLLGGTEPPDWAGLLERFRAGTGRPLLLDAARVRDVGARHPDEAAAVIDAADRVAENRFAFFAHPEVRLPDPIDWHYDPITDQRWPAIPASRINHRTHGGDPKWIWELNRLQHLPWLAQAWLLTGDERYAEVALRHLDSWIEANPPGVGIAWRGAFEAGVRATSVAVALQGLRDAPGLTPELFGRVVSMLAESARRCWRDRSRFSSANNHLVGELGGLLTVALLLPELAPAAGWRRRGLAALAAEHRQILPDGAGAEQAPGYQMYTADVFCLIVAVLRSAGEVVPPELSAALRRDASFLVHLMDEDGRLPRYGDDDEGFAIRLDASPQRTAPAHVRSVRAVLGEAAADDGDLTAELLHRAANGPGSAPIPDSTVPIPGPDGRGFFAPHGGIVVLRSPGHRTVMDVGPLGYLSIAAHGHADALAVTLDVHGRELITDPGTGSYYAHPEWRREHRGTQLHATVCVDGLDQSVMAGAFLWSRRASVRVLHVDLEAGTVCAEHDGYRRLDPPVTHRRWLHAPAGSDAIVVLDLVEGSGPHRVSTSWPLHPTLAVQRQGQEFLAADGQRPLLRVATACSRRAEEYAVRGAPGPGEGDVGGWWSDRLDRRVPAWRVGSRCDTDGPVVFATLLALHSLVAEPLELRLDISGTDATLGWSDPAGPQRLSVDLTGVRPLATEPVPMPEG